MCISLFLCDSLLLDVCANCCFVYPQVPPVLAQKVFTQIFSYINVQLFNRWTYISSFVSCMPGNLRSTWVHECFLFCSLLLRRECCSFSNGEYVKAGLAELELWCAKATTEVICLCLNASFPSYMIQFTEAPSFFFSYSMLQHPGMSSSISGRLLAFWYDVHSACVYLCWGLAPIKCCSFENVIWLSD